MLVTLNKISKHYGFQWVIRDATFQLDQNRIYGFKGPNGSGKSTLLQIISGYLSPSGGEVRYFYEGSPVSRDDVFRHISISAPYIDLIEDFSLREVFQLCHRFGGIEENIDWKQFLEFSGLSGHSEKVVKNLSSGLKQRLKVSLTLCSDAPLLILDEPTSYFDVASKKWFYHQLPLRRESQKILIATNDPEDIAHCDVVLDILEYKQGS